MTEPPRSPAPAAGDDGQLRISSPLAGMRLTQLLTEVQDRLATVARTQERVQDLLDAFLSVSAGLDLDTTLHQIAEAATGLVDARYGALGVLHPVADWVPSSRSASTRSWPTGWVICRRARACSAS